MFPRYSSSFFLVVAAAPNTIMLFHPLTMTGIFGMDGLNATSTNAVSLL